MEKPSLRQRTHDCNSLGMEHVGSTVLLMGWVSIIRDWGGALFLDLRDRYGLTQVVFDASKDQALLERVSSLRSEDVIAVSGVVTERIKKNEKIATGEVEVSAEDFYLFSRSEVLPFPVRDEINAGTEIRLKYRYLDLRRPSMQRILITRSRISHFVRNILFDENFLEVETPFMVKYTPGGARNFMVPSRLQPGSVYALAESPQIYKQLLMVAGYDRYFQLAKCFRDEDPRLDRQLEFTQIDLEMSFADDGDITDMVEKLFIRLWEKLGLDFTATPFPRMTWDEAMARYGTDKPDTRFGMPHVVLNDFATGCGVGILESANEQGMLIKGLVVKGKAAEFSRKVLDDLTALVKREEVGPAKGLIWLKVEADNTLKGPIAKLMDENIQAMLCQHLELEEGDLLFIIADEPKITHKAMDFLRRELAGRLDLVDPGVFAPLWVVNFPMFEINEEGQWTSSHHPFTHPHPGDLPLLGTPRQGEVKSLAYDLVINGNEVGGGSVRIHDPEIQARVFTALGISDDEAQRLFGFLLEAFKYGVPPHAGFAAGLDRLVMIITKTESLRDVIAFP
ncbi:aspartate--tRNA ligase, partial [Myxococcota bacterium]|nr:aspartate--tRNA ligase [Myxococcota bacterium]